MFEGYVSEMFVPNVGIAQCVMDVCVTELYVTLSQLPRRGAAKF